MRRAYVRGQKNLQKREYIAASAQNLGLLMRQRYRMGTPRSLQDRRAVILLQHAPREQAA